MAGRNKLFPKVPQRAHAAFRWFPRALPISSTSGQP